MFFRSMSARPRSRMVALLCSVLRRCIFLKGDVLCEQGTIPNEMYFLEGGRVMSLKKDPRYNGIDENDNNKQNHDGSKKSLTDVLKSRNSCSPSKWGATSHLVKQKGNSHLFNASGGDQRASAGWNSQASTRSGHDDKGLGNRRQSRLGNCVYISRVGAAIGSELLFGVPQYATFTSVNRTVCLAVFRDDLMTVLNDFAADAKQMRRNFVESIRLEDPERCASFLFVAMLSKCRRNICGDSVPELWRKSISVLNFGESLSV